MFGRLVLVYGSKALAAVLLLASSTFVARSWGAAALGTYSVFLTILTVGSLFAVFGADMKFIEMAPKMARGANYDRAVCDALVSVLFQSCVVLPALVVVTFWITPDLAWSASAVVPMALTTTVGGILLSRNQQVLNSLLLHVVRPANLLLVFVFCFFFQADFVRSVFLGVNFSYLMTALIGVLFLRGVHAFSLRITALSKSQVYSSLIYVFLGLYPILLAQADRLIAVKIVGAAETGIYAAAQNLLNVATYGVNAVMAFLLPLTAAVLSGKLDYASFSGKAKMLSRGLFIFSVFCLLGFFLFGELLVSLFGDGFSGAVVPLRIMGIGVALGLVFGAPITVLSLSESKTSVIWAFLLTLIISLLLSTVLIYFFGIIGAATATAVANVGSRGLFHVLCVKRTGISTAIF